MGFLSLIQEMSKSTSAIILILLLIGIVVISGWTDAPNAIATCVSTRVIYINYAICMSVVFNFIGILLYEKFGGKVVLTVYEMFDFSSSKFSAGALIAAFVTIIIWGLVAYIKDIPTSSTYALIGALTGSSLAIHAGVGGINIYSFIKVIVGIVLSTTMPVIFGYIIVTLIKKICRNKDRNKVKKIFDRGQILSGALNALMHGAQDGQKFIALFLLVIYLFKISPTINSGLIGIALLIAILVGLGTSLGGVRAIRNTGVNVVNLESYEGISSDFASSLTLFILTVMGIPVSTNYAFSSALVGVGVSKRVSNVNWSYAKYIFLIRLLAFPICILCAYIFTKIIMIIGG